MIITGFDCETTGIKPDEHRFIEVCCHMWHLESRTRRIAFVRRINPQRSILAEAERVHGINNSDVAGCPTFDHFAPLIQKIAANTDLWVAHNGIDFDMPFLDAEMRRAGLALPKRPCFDTMVDGRWATPMGKVPNLGELCFACGVDYYPSAAHAADYDVEVMMESFFKGLDWGWYKLPAVPARVAA